jgi:hypothetical protein
MPKQKPTPLFETESFIENNIEFQNFAKSCRFPGQSELNLVLKGSEAQ